MVQHREADDDVKRSVAKRELGTIAGTDVDPFTKHMAKVRGKVWVDFDCGNSAAALKQPASRHAITRPDLQHVAIKLDAFTRPWQHLRVHPVGPLL
jgi:hypothetical protein